MLCWHYDRIFIPCNYPVRDYWSLRGLTWPHEGRRSSQTGTGSRPLSRINYKTSKMAFVSLLLDSSNYGLLEPIVITLLVSEADRSSPPVKGSKIWLIWWDNHHFIWCFVHEWAKKEKRHDSVTFTKNVFSLDFRPYLLFYDDGICLKCIFMWNWTKQANNTWVLLIFLLAWQPCFILWPSLMHIIGVTIVSLLKRRLKCLFWGFN